jgi:hypothetical protein
MDTTVMWGFVLMGAGAVVAGIVGLALPAGERIAAFLTLVIGAGVGIAALAIGSTGASDSVGPQEDAFLVASALGFVAVVVSALVLWRRGVRKNAGHDASG